MPIIKLKDINLHTRNRVLQVRLCRIWKWKRLSSTDDGSQLQCVMVDKYNGAIHALISDFAFEEGQQKLTVGQLYHVWNYNCIPNQSSYIVVPHEVQLLIHKNTQFRMIPEVYPRIPLHWFQFTEFEDLHTRLDRDTHLTDVIGYISRVQPITDVSLHGKTTAKQIIEIKNIRNETMYVAIWGETVDEFNSVALDTLDSPLVVSFTSTRVRKRDEKLMLHSTPNTCIFMNPLAHETDELMARFGQNFNPTSLLTATAGLVNIQDYMFTIEATIIKVENPKGWYYMACDKCDMELEPSDRPYILCCPIHGYQLGIPVYQVELCLQDPTGSLQAIIMGNTAENFFGISCFELVYQHGYTDPTILPQILADKLLMTFKWRLGPHNMDAFLVHSVTPTMLLEPNVNSKTISDMQQQYAPIRRTSAVVSEASTSSIPPAIN